MNEENVEETDYIDVDFILTSLDARIGYYVRVYGLSGPEAQIKVLDDFGLENQIIADWFGKTTHAINMARQNGNQKLPFNERTKGKRASKN